MPLFIFDFDLTITSDHTHNIIANAICHEKKTLGTQVIKHSPEKQWDLVKDIAPIASAEKWRSLFQQIDQAGHTIAIASFNHYGDLIIPRYLRDVLGLPETLLNKICIKSWKPTDPKGGKNEHINQIYKTTGYDSPYLAATVLIDDSSTNLDKADEHSHSTILATSNGDHLNHTATFLDNFSSDRKRRLFETLQDYAPRGIQLPPPKSFSFGFFNSEDSSESLSEEDEKLTPKA